MHQSSRDAVIQRDMVIKGKITNGRRIEVYGYLEGHVDAETVVVHDGGRLFGTLRAENAEIRGDVQGEAVVKQLISIGTGGSVSGNVRYGRIAMEPGGQLSAEMRNIPPEISGDLQLAVGRSRSVTITSMDLAANDPDDKAKDLTFTVSNVMNGWVVFAADEGQAIAQFTQADLGAGGVIFRHDGSAGASASFDVVVADAKGETSGAPRTVRVHVKG